MGATSGSYGSGRPAIPSNQIPDEGRRAGGIHERRMECSITYSRKDSLARMSAGLMLLLRLDKVNAAIKLGRINEDRALAELERLEKEVAKL